MMSLRFLGGAVVFLTAAATLSAQQYAPPNAKKPDDATLRAVAQKTARLGQAVEVLRRQGVRDPFLADVEVYHKAAVWIVRHGEFYQADIGPGILDALDRGLLRAAQLAQGEAPWAQQRGQSVVRAYRSRVDGSVQPYAVILPPEYGKDPARRWRLDVVLHGRDASLTEVKFLRQHAGDKPAPAQNYIELHIFGRTNNAYRWAGETDVYEAVDNFLAVERQLGREALLDPARVVLRGFSMGGAGTWHLGLHRPDRFCVLGPGAGFTTTHGYIKTLPEKLPPYQEDCLHIYDAVDYAENAFNVPVVAYSGDMDPQMEAARNIEAKLKSAGIPVTHLVAPGLGHQFPPEWRQKAESHYGKHAARGRESYPPRVRFVTYTLKYAGCAWVELLALDRHYDRTVVDATRNEEGFKVATTNVRALRLTWPPDVAARESLTVVIDDKAVKARPYVAPTGAVSVVLQKRNGEWSAILPQKLLGEQQRQPQKIPGRQGPIDDAFAEAFLCVRGTGPAWDEAADQYAVANLKRFQGEWNKFLRGDLPVKDDVDVTEEDIATRHLILFGDPSSNSLIGQVLDGLPLRWTKESVTLGKRLYPAAGHVPVLIYPNPLNATRYVVLNSGHTFRAADFQGTNALLYPRLGDYAVLKLAPTAKDPAAAAVATAGLFDEFWRVKE